MSDIQRWEFFQDCIGDCCCDIDHNDSGHYILHADIVKVFAWMVEHQVAFDDDAIWWSKRNEPIKIQKVPDGDFLGAIVRLMGGDDE